MNRFLILISLISFTSLGSAQIKYEKEIRIQKVEVPEKASGFVDSMNLAKKIKWYKEIGYKINSITYIISEF